MTMFSNAAWMVGLGVAALGISGCALTSRSEPIRIRYYTLEDSAAQSSAPAQRDVLELRIGRIDAGQHLDEEIAFRNGPHELEYYDDRRWTEKPQEYLRRALNRALFQDRGVTRMFGGQAPALDVELVQFEQVLGPKPMVHVQANVMLRDDRRSTFSQTFDVERPYAAEDTSGDAAATAFSSALRDAVGNIADRVVAELQRNRAAASGVTSGSDTGTPSGGSPTAANSR
jgi:cholesterol transport system auxiliary component